MSWLHSALQAASVMSPFRNLWPLFVAPAVAALISDRTATLVPRTPAGTLPAAALAAVPGLVGLAVIRQTFVTGTIITWKGVLLLWVTPLVAVALLAYAIIRAARRQTEVGRLFALAKPAGPRLADAAAKLGLRTLEIPNDAKDCFVAGVFRPTVFVSSGALAKLDDDELLAALHHERAHIRNLDTLSLTLLALLRDLAPWGRGAALEAFCAAREAAADHVAARSAGSFNLAAALVALARPGHETLNTAVLPMARGDNLRRRMHALLDGDTTQNPHWSLWAKVVGGLCLSSIFLTWPLVQLQVLTLMCLDH